MGNNEPLIPVLGKGFTPSLPFPVALARGAVGKSNSLACLLGLVFAPLNATGPLSISLHQKIIEKNAKIEDLPDPRPFQNPSKNLPKSMSQKTCDFSWICVRKMLHRTSADINFALVFTVFFACRTLFLVSLFTCIFDLKNLPKTLPK